MRWVRGLCRTYGAWGFSCYDSQAFRPGLSYFAPTALSWREAEESFIAAGRPASGRRAARGEADAGLLCRCGRRAERRTQDCCAAAGGARRGGGEFHRCGQDCLRRAGLPAAGRLTDASEGSAKAKRDPCLRQAGFSRPCGIRMTTRAARGERGRGLFHRCGRRECGEARIRRERVSPRRACLRQAGESGVVRGRLCLGGGHLLGYTSRPVVA